MCAKARVGGGGRWGGGGVAGWDGGGLVHQTEHWDLWGDTMPSEGGTGTCGGIFQHALLHEWAAIRGTFLYITRKAPCQSSLLALERFSTAWISTYGASKEMYRNKGTVDGFYGIMFSCMVNSDAAFSTFASFTRDLLSPCTGVSVDWMHTSGNWPNTQPNPRLV